MAVRGENLSITFPISTVLESRCL